MESFKISKYVTYYKFITNKVFTSLWSFLLVFFVGIGWCTITMTNKVMSDYEGYRISRGFKRIDIENDFQNVVTLISSRCSSKHLCFFISDFQNVVTLISSRCLSRHFCFFISD